MPDRPGLGLLRASADEEPFMVLVLGRVAGPRKDGVPVLSAGPLTATGSAKTATTSANGTDIVNGDRVLAGCD